MKERTERLSPLLQLRTLPALTGIPSNQLRVLARETEEVTVRAGNQLRRSSESAEAMHIVTSGRFRVTRGERAWTVGPGEEIGFLEVVAGEVAGAEVVAETDCSALCIDGDALRNASERYAPILIRLLEEVARRVVGRPDVLLSAIRGPADQPGTGPGLDRVGRILALHRASAFPSGSMDALAELAGLGGERGFRAGEPLWKTGSPAASAFVICSGQADYLDKGTPVGRMGPGSVPGLPLLLAGGIRALEAIAVTDMVTLEIHREVLLDVLEDHFEMAWGIMASFAGHLLAD